MKINIVGAQVDRYNFDEVVEITIERALTGTSPVYIVTPNAQHINNLQNDSLFRKIYSKAFLVVPDGVSILWAAKFLKTPLKGKVSGSNLFEKLCERAALKPLKIFLLGGRPQAADRAAKVLEHRYPGLKIAGTYCPPYGFEYDSLEINLINQRILNVAPDILFVGLGSPKQEKWIYTNYQKLKIPVSIGVGVSFEFTAGMVKKAPVWMQKNGLEWLFRMIVEPKRLWRRYVIGNPLFIFLVLRQKNRLASISRQVWTLTAYDAAYFANVTDRERVRVLNVPANQVILADLVAETSCDLAMLGTWTWQPNQEGLQWFFERVYPHLPTTISIQVAGKGADWLLRRYPNVKYCGFVPDARAFITQAKAIAIPVVSGGGIQIKTLEAISVGASIVATPTALRGIDNYPQSVRVASEPQEFANLAIELISLPIVDRQRPDAIDWSQRRQRDFCREVGRSIGNIY